MGASSYDGSGGVLLPAIGRELDQMATLLAPEESPYLDSLMANTGPQLNSTKLEWQDYALKARTVTTASGAQDTTGDTAITCSEDVSAIVYAGDQLTVDGTQEVLLVTAVSSTNLTVTRGYGGTVKATIPSGTTLTISSQSSLEGEAYVNKGNHYSTQRYNYTQIIKSGFEISGTLEAIQYAVSLEGRNTQLGVDIELTMREMMQKLASTVFVGVAPASTTQGSSSVRRTMNGIREMVREGSAAGTGAIYSNIASADFNQSTNAEKNLISLVKQMRDLGARPNLLVMNSRILNQLATNREGGRQDFQSSIISRDLTRVQTPFGELGIMYDQFIPSDSLLITERGRAGLRFLRGFTLEPLAKVGDSQRWQIVAELTMQAQDAATGRHGWFYGAAA